MTATISAAIGYMIFFCFTTQTVLFFTSIIRGTKSPTNTIKFVQKSYKETDVRAPYAVQKNV